MTIIMDDITVISYEETAKIFEEEWRVLHEKAKKHFN